MALGLAMGRLVEVDEIDEASVEASLESLGASPDGVAFGREQDGSQPAMPRRSEAMGTIETIGIVRVSMRTRLPRRRAWITLRMDHARKR